MQIQKTKDYSQFKILNFNREIDKSHVSKLKKAISTENLLEIHPILVNKDMEVLDGQHRLHAAKELGIDVYYVVGNVDYKHLIDLNTNQKIFSSKDTVKYYSIYEKNKHYQLLEKYTKQSGVSHKATIGLLGFALGGQLSKKIISGKLEFPEDTSKFDAVINQYNNFIVRCIEKKVTPLTMFKNFNFCSAFNILVNHPSFTEKQFYYGFENRWYELKPKGTRKEWIKTLIEIYNFKNREKIDVAEYVKDME